MTNLINGEFNNDYTQSKALNDRILHKHIINKKRLKKPVNTRCSTLKAVKQIGHSRQLKGLPPLAPEDITKRM